MLKPRIRKLPPVQAYYLIMGLTAWIHLQQDTIAALYLIRVADLDPLQLVLVGTVMELSMFLAEVPTGVVADVFSRRLSVIVGTFLTGISALIVGLVPEFGYILLAQMVGALGFAFGSGALEAWLSDEVRGRDVGRHYLRGTQVGFVASLLGIGSGVVLGSMFLALPILVAGGMSIALALGLAAVMPERGFKRPPEGRRHPWMAMTHILVRGARTVRRRPPLLIIAAITLFYGAASEPLNRLWELHILTNFTFPGLGNFSAVVWLGLINAAVMVAGAGMVEVVRRHINVERPEVTVKTLFVANALITGGVLAFALIGEFALAVISYVIASSLWEATFPVFTTWTNRNADSDVRATVFSMMSQTDAIGQVGGGPLLGYAARVRSVKVALVGTVLLLAPVQLVLGAAMRVRSLRTME